MKTTVIVLALLSACFALGFCSSIPRSSNDNPMPESRSFLQQLLINQIVNVLPVNTRDKINDAAATFNLTRNQFLLRCLKELQAFQEYSKIDFITAIQKTVKFVDDKLTDEQRESLDALEIPGIQLATLLFDNQLLPGQLNKVYDLEVLVVRQKIDPQAFVDQLPILLEEILAQHL